MEVIGCPWFYVVEFDNLKTLHAETTNESGEHAGIRFDDGERSADEIVFVPVVRSGVGTRKDGRGVDGRVHGKTRVAL
jgi:hypothetical protein